MVIAEDGNLLSTDGARADLAYSVFTLPAQPGQFGGCAMRIVGHVRGLVSGLATASETTAKRLERVQKAPRDAV